MTSDARTEVTSDVDKQLLWTTVSTFMTAASAFVVFLAIAQMITTQALIDAPTPEQLNHSLHAIRVATAVACGVSVAGAFLAFLARRWVAGGVHVGLLLLSLAAAVALHIPANAPIDPPRSSVPPAVPSTYVPCFSGSGRCN